MQVSFFKALLTRSGDSMPKLDKKIVHIVRPDRERDRTPVAVTR